MRYEQHSAASITGITRRKSQQSLDAINHPDAHLRLDTVLTLAGVSRSQWYRLIESGDAPKPMRFGQRCSRWLARDVATFLADRAKKAGVQ